MAYQSSSILSADIALDASDPIIGSFTVDGLTYSVSSGGLTLVAVDASVVAEDGSISIPASVTYNGMTYPVTTIAPYAFYLSGVAQVDLPASIASVDDRAFRSSDVERVEVATGNPNFASFDGALYDASLNRLLLIPEGRAGAVLLPSETEVAEPSVFSHCSLVEAINVEEDGAAFASWEGLLYDASGTSLLRVPAGVTDITIRDGCTAIAAGAMEGCAKLERINAPASVTSISPDVFTSVPIVSLPASAVAGSSDEAEGEAEVTPRRVVASSQGLSAPLALPDLGSTSASPSSEAADTNDAEAQPSSHGETNPGVASGLPDQLNASTNFIPQLTAMVALSTTDDDLPEINPSSIEAALPEGADAAPWQAAGLSAVRSPAVVAFQGAATYQNSLVAQQVFTIPQGLLLVHGGNDPDAPPINADGSYSAAHVAGWTSGSPPAFSHTTEADDGNNIKWVHYTLNCTSDMPTPNNHTFMHTCYDRGSRYGWIGYKATASHHTFVGAPDGKFRKVKEFRYYTKDGAPVPAGATFPTGTFVFLITCTQVAFDNAGASAATPAVEAAYSDDLPAITPPSNAGSRFMGYYDQPAGQGTRYYDETGTSARPWDKTDSSATLYAHWQPYEIGFDVDSEPGDVDYPGEEKPSVSAPDAVQSDGTIPIEDPKRPGYVFQGWVLPNAEGAEAVDQELVYQDDDGKWYVDASRLPDYAGDDGRVELTARWTSVISVDVPQSVTFYADTVTQGQESREGAASSAFGQNKVANQSEVDLRVVGLESSAVETTDTTLGADSILKKADAATPSSSAGKLLSLYPSAKQWTADELQDSDLEFEAKPAAAVDFDLDDILLEASFPSDSFTIAAGDTLNMGYRLNLAETGQQLDYDKLSTLEDGQSAAIANVSYCFAAGHTHASATGSTDDDIYIEYGGKVYGTFDILGAANCISELGEASPCYATYDAIMRAQGVPSNGYLPTDAEAKIYAKYAGPEATASQPNCDRAGYVRLLLLGVNHDSLKLSVPADQAYDYEAHTAKRVGLTFQFMDILFWATMNEAPTNEGGWQVSTMRNRWLADERMPGYDPDAGSIYNYLAVHEMIKEVQRFSNVIGGGAYTASVNYDWKAILRPVADKLFLPHYVEYAGLYDDSVDYLEGGRAYWQFRAGYQYEYWRDVCGVKRGKWGVNCGPWEKRYYASQQIVGYWNGTPLWQEAPTSGFDVFTEVGPQYANQLDGSYAYGVAPAFCL